MAKPRATSVIHLLAWVGCLSLLGCATTRPPIVPPALPSLPQTHEKRAGTCVLVSDLPLDRDPALLAQIEQLPEEVCRELQLPPSNQIVQVYLFKDRERYETYMHCQFPELPYRRAYFVARSEQRRGEELCIYTYWGDHVREDLRHELTHATLHSLLHNVPLWLDEGLAEYFEVPAEARGINPAHTAALAHNREPDMPTWPDLAALEKLQDMPSMSAADYRASWSMVHWMLRGSPQGRAVLLQYLRELRQPRPAPPFAPLLLQAVPRYQEEVRGHAKGLSRGSWRSGYWL